MASWNPSLLSLCHFLLLCFLCTVSDPDLWPLCGEERSQQGSITHHINITVFFLNHSPPVHPLCLIYPLSFFLLSPPLLLLSLSFLFLSLSFWNVLFRSSWVEECCCNKPVHNPGEGGSVHTHLSFSWRLFFGYLPHFETINNSCSCLSRVCLQSRAQHVWGHGRMSISGKHRERESVNVSLPVAVMKQGENVCPQGGMTQLHVAQPLPCPPMPLFFRIHSLYRESHIWNDS